MSFPKVVVIGAGSMFFGRQALAAMIKSPHLRNGTLAYVDIDEGRLNKMMALASRAIKHARSPLKLEGSSDHKDVLKGADFVILTFIAVWIAR
jgi:alpha-galactosidase/6-phospho-beta-glucosidase family protein